MSEENNETVLEGTTTSVSSIDNRVPKEKTCCVCTTESRCVECYDKECNCA